MKDPFIYVLRWNRNGTSAAYSPPWIYCSFHPDCASEHVALVQNVIRTAYYLCLPLSLIRNFDTMAFSSFHSHSNRSLHFFNSATWASRRTTFAFVRPISPFVLTHTSLFTTFLERSLCTVYISSSASLVVHAQWRAFSKNPTPRRRWLSFSVLYAPSSSSSPLSSICPFTLMTLELTFAESFRVLLLHASQDLLWSCRASLSGGNQFVVKRRRSAAVSFSNHDTLAGYCKKHPWFEFNIFEFLYKMFCLLYLDTCQVLCNVIALTKYC